jgi:hypothetical protein
LNGLDQRTPLRRQPDTSCFYFIQQFAAFQHRFLSRLVATHSH